MNEKEIWKAIIDGASMPLWSYAIAYWINGWPTVLEQESDLPCWPTSWTWPG